ncbi:MAG TPA: arginine--tRNA ligase [Saprospiraceae bacterium]|nr:arginine--tRNA ligase [Saprospiraceae bacterium]
MTDIIKDIVDATVESIQKIYQVQVSPGDILVTPTKKEHKGDYTLVTFSLAKSLRLPPAQIATSIGDYIKVNRSWVSDVEVVQGFLNLSLSADYWFSTLKAMRENPEFWKPVLPKEKILVEFASPNTNKPLHLGHIRNILLGWATSKILEACGHDVKRVQIVNDRGIAICKSMLAWEKYSFGQSPDDVGQKSDHFVGDWYVRFEVEFSSEYSQWQQTDEAQEIFKNRKEKELSEKEFFKNYKNHYFNTGSTLGKEARELLLKWEANDPDTKDLWRKMNQWVYDGFEETYKKLGVHFDKLYYESDTYLFGKDIIEEGLKKKAFYKKDDGSVWVDLTDYGLDHKLLLRSDGTSVYMTQDLGTAHKRYEEFGAERMVYVVADEQNYHFQALFAIMAKLGAPYAAGLHHLSYGMVDLPEGKMKSREGTVVDADDLMEDVIEEASTAAIDREMSDMEIIRKIGMAALKFFIIKVDPRKRMTFDPKASVDLQGQTGPYIQNAYVRIQSILRKAGTKSVITSQYEVNEDEKLLLSMLGQCRQIIEDAAKDYSPALIANYTYALAKEYHRYYHDVKVLQAESEEAKVFRLELISIVANVLEKTMDLLGIEMPERM